VDVQFDAIGAECQTVVECGDGVFWRERASTAMGKDQRPRRREERMAH
jgi:hypothetical protein